MATDPSSGENAAMPALPAAAPAAAPPSSTTGGDISGLDQTFAVVLGGQWGDEGKGKLVDILAQNADVVARFNGGANAGHSLKVEGVKYAFHLLPCGILSQTCENFLGNGVVCHIPTLMKELEQLRGGPFEKALERLFISSRTALLFDLHQAIDGYLEAMASGKAIGTTKRGIGPCYSTKALRNGLRFCDLLHFDDSFVLKFRELVAWAQQCYPDAVDKQGRQLSAYPVEAEIRQYREYGALLAPQIVDGVSWMHARIAAGKRVLAEGANAALLDVDFGTYPYVTSAPTTAGGICTGLGVPPSAVKCVIGVVKAFLTRVGNGPFPTECTSPDCPDDKGRSVNPEEAEFFDGWLAKQDEIRAKGVGHGPQPPRTGQFVGDFFRDIGYEYGTTTGRPRRCGWLDVPLTRYAAMVNGYASVNVTKLDCLSGLKTLKIAVAYRLGGRMLEPGEFPTHLPSLAAVKVEYIEMQGWPEDITKCTAYSQLPEPAKAYVAKVEELLGVAVSWVGVGPDREAMFLKD